MSPRIRKLVGTVLLLVVLTIYSLIVMVAASVMAPGGSKIVELIFYATAGVVWVLPAGYLIKWMYAASREAA
jgi:hypothetical protein